MDATKKETDNSPRKSGGWKTLLIRAIILLVIIGLAGAFLIRQMNQATKRKNLEDSILQELKQPQKIALDAIRADSTAKEAMGEDIKDAGGLGREGTGELDRTAVVIHFEIAGSKQKGRVAAAAALKQGAWQVTDVIQIKLADGKSLTIAKPGEKPPDINLDF